MNKKFKKRIIIIIILLILFTIIFILLGHPVLKVLFYTGFFAAAGIAYLIDYYYDWRNFV